ncbi:MAG: PepSY-like domain-containing protein [Bacteroidales bacterium]|jgi:hypothetical protein|nr:PepSY-like domain-containing protein [Bacteroidales bacterium]
MKRIVLFCFSLILLTSLTVSAQKLKKENVPNDVVQTLDYEYPGVKITAWIMEEEQYVALFKEDGNAAKAYFTPDGKWNMTTYSIPKNELPSNIRDWINEHYPFFTYSLIQLRSTPDEKMYYYVEMKPEDVLAEKSLLYFDDKGIITKRKDPPSYKDPVKKSTASKEDITASDNYTKVKNDNNEVVYIQKETKKGQSDGPVYDEQGNVAISQSAVPEVVLKSFSKKMPHPESLNWFKIDSFYVGKCIFREQKNEVFMTPTGEWVKSLTQLNQESITGNMFNYLEKFYKGWRFQSAVKETRVDKEDKTLIEIVEKPNYRSGLLTILMFDKTGKLIRTFDPEYPLGENDEAEEEMDKGDINLEKYYAKMAMGSSAEGSKETPEHILTAFKAKYPRIINPQWLQDDDGNYQAIYAGARGKEIVLIGQSGTILQTLTEGNLEVIPENIAKTVKKENKGFKIDSYYAVKDLQTKKNLYKILISNKKTSENRELWFTTSGQSVNM